MALDGSGFHVELDVLEDAAKSIRDALRDQDSAELRSLCGESEEYGHTGLRDALMDFCTRWSDEIDSVASEGEEIGDALSASAAAYREVDASAVSELPSDPALDEADG